MKVVFTGSYTFDEASEKKRILSCFKGKVKERQLELLDLFVAGKFNEWIALYNKLPYSETDECSEKEYVGLYSEILRDLVYAKFEYSDLHVEDVKN